MAATLTGCAVLDLAQDCEGTDPRVEEMAALHILDSRPDKATVARGFEKVDAGGSIGYRTALGDQHLTDSVADWVTRVSSDTGSSDNPVASMAQEIRNMFFKPGLTGSIFGSAPPIWQELDFKTCTDGTIKKVSGAPVLRSSFMPNQYLYRNNEAIDLDGSYTGSSAPVTTGDFYHFSGPDIPPPPAEPDQSMHPYASCDITSGHGGNPWNIGAIDDAAIDPSTAHFCNAPGKSPDPAFSR
jgi:hypothetical protein